jgi:hypothetical protein
MQPPVTRVLRAEGLAVLALAVAGYSALGGSWLLFGLLFLVPDLSMAGYLRGPRMGAALYNAGHAYLVPALVALGGWWGGSPPAVQVALIWAAHIGFDRALGYGLKLPAGFRHTHLGMVGRGGGAPAGGQPDAAGT